MKSPSPSLTQSISIEKGWYIHFGEKDTEETYIINGFSQSDSDLIESQNIYSKKDRVFTLSELFNIEEPPYPFFVPNLQTLHLEFEKEEKPFLDDTSSDSDIPEVYRNEAKKIIAVVKFIDEFIENYKKDCRVNHNRFRRLDAINLACEKASLLPEVKREIKKSTYYNYNGLYLKFSGDVLRIAGAKRRKSLGQLKLNLAQQNFAASIILEYVAGDGTRLSPSSAFEEGKKILSRTQNYWIDPTKCKDGKVPPDLIRELLDKKIPFENIFSNREKKKLLKIIKRPSLPWFYKYCKWFIHNPKSGEKEFRNKFGDEFYENEMLIFDKYLSIAQFPLQYVFADHCLLDVFIIDKDGRKEVFRCWLTLIIDVWSRCVLGFVLLDEYPSVESIQLALRNAIFLKDKLLNKAGIDPKLWQCFGIPLSLSLDNAWAHLSLSLENLARTISHSGTFDSIEIVLRPPYKGRYGAIIERYFGRLQSRLKKYFIGSYKKSTPQAIRSAKNQASLLYEDLYLEILKIIVDYQNSPHSELDGLTPNQRWDQAFRTRKPKIPNLTSEVERLFWRSYPQKRQLTDSGISFLGMDYYSKELGEEERFNKSGEKVWYEIKYSTTDISRIAVFRGDRWICDAYAQQLKIADKKYRKTSLFERDLARKIAASYGESKENWISHLDDKELLNQRKMEQKRIAKLAREENSSEIIDTLKTATPPVPNKFTTVVEEENYDELTSAFLNF